MRKRFVTLLAWLNALGIEPYKAIAACRYFPRTISEYWRLKRQNSSLQEKWTIKFSYPSFHDRIEAGGTASGHYFHQDLLVARRIYERNPEKHVDVGSRVDGFVAHVAVFREIEVFDVRPITSQVKNIVFVQDDLM